jgi:penicillin G amidase
MTSETIENLKKINLNEDNFSFKNLNLKHLIPKIKNSNNWVISPVKSKTNTTLFSCDPHLDITTIPTIWYEAILETKDISIMGITVPGSPAFIMGRNKNLAWSFTVFNH